MILVLYINSSSLGLNQNTEAVHIGASLIIQADNQNSPLRHHCIGIISIKTYNIVISSL